MYVRGSYRIDSEQGDGDEAENFSPDSNQHFELNKKIVC